MIEPINALDKDKLMENQSISGMTASGIIRSIKAAADGQG